MCVSVRWFISFHVCGRYLDITLLKDPKFIAMCLSVMMMSTGCPYMLYFLPAYALSAGMWKEMVQYFDYSSGFPFVSLYMRCGQEERKLLIRLKNIKHICNS